MKRIEKLTPEQEALLPQFRQQWFQHGISTARSDRHKAEAAILAMRQEIGVTARPTFIWCDSPATSLLSLHYLKSDSFAAFVKKAGATIRDHAPAKQAVIADRVGRSLWASLWASLGDSLGASLVDSLGASLGASLWDSLGASLRASLGASLGASLRDSLGDSMWASLGDSMGASLGDSLRDSLWASLGASLRASLRDSLWDSLGDSLWASLRASLWASLWDSLGASLRASLWASLRASNPSLASELGNAWWGQHDSYWIAFYLFCRDIVGFQYDPKRSRQLDLWRDIAESCCWWWCFENYVVISERPTVVEMDERSRIHSNAGPAIAFADGWKVYASHGVRLPADVIEEPKSITVARIEAEQNAEVRRVMVEKYGQDRYLMDSGAREIHRDDFGILYGKEMPGDELIVMVKVINSSPEPDGSFREYFLRVPPDTTTARGAIAWTFGKTEAEYAPAIQT